MLELIIESAFVLWFLVSVAAHIPAWKGIRNKINLGGLLPNWYLFTAQLLVQDLCLRSRRQSSVERFTLWTDVPIRLPQPHFLFIWNPERRLSKSILDCVDAIIQARIRGKREQALQSMPFYLLYEWSRRNSPSEQQNLQFCIALRVKQFGTVQHQILFLSPSSSTNELAS